MFSLYSSILQTFVECVSINLLTTIFMNVLRNILYIYFTISQECKKYTVHILYNKLRMPTTLHLGCELHACYTIFRMQYCSY